MVNKIRIKFLNIQIEVLLLYMNTFLIWIWIEVSCMNTMLFTMSLRDSRWLIRNQDLFLIIGIIILGVLSLLIWANWTFWNDSTWLSGMRWIYKLWFLHILIYTKICILLPITRSVYPLIICICWVSCLNRWDSLLSII